MHEHIPAASILAVTLYELPVQNESKYDSKSEFVETRSGTAFIGSLADRTSALQFRPVGWRRESAGESRGAKAVTERPGP
jgi:hypothetical protein